ncbi:hypothetical protein CDAR_301831 [Caerostris darwini]|uniref:Uncharacterized protein n=1 Tax=Caerostris darwini TaxID=1538125 RepID=A0AAV4VE39_9ARAC|nr:hypothetical protein CDAR_301831 [Caerostris darwini]
MRPSCMYCYPSSQTAALLILKCPTKQSPKKVSTRDGRWGQESPPSPTSLGPSIMPQKTISKERANKGWPKRKSILASNAPDISRTLYEWDAICPRMTDGAARNTLFCLANNETRGRLWMGNSFRTPFIKINT